MSRRLALGASHGHGCRRGLSTAHEALLAMRGRAAQAAKRAGFQDRLARLPSGEPLPFLERPPASGAEPSSVVVFLHGMTNDRIMSAACFAKATASLPNARCLLPDAPGHGGRTDWAFGKGGGFTPPSADEHVADFEAVLSAMLSTESATKEKCAPLDLIGYRLCGCHRVRRVNCNASDTL